MLLKINFNYFSVSFNSIIYIINFFLLCYLICRFIWMLYYSPNILITILEFLFILNYISLILMEISYVWDFEKLINGIEHFQSLTQLLKLYENYSKIYTRYFIHGGFLILKVFVILTCFECYKIFLTLVKSFFNTFYKLLKCILSILFIKFFIWILYEILKNDMAIVSLDSIYILFCKFDRIEDFLGRIDIID